MPKLSSQREVKPILVEYTEEEIKRILTNDALNQIKSSPAHANSLVGQRFNLVFAESDSYRGMKLTFIPTKE